MLHIRLLGKTEITLENAAPPVFRGKTGLWLVGLLTLHANRSVERDWLAGILWPDSAPEQGRANLRRALTDVRHAVGDAASARLTSPTAHTVSLRLAENEADVLAFRAGSLERYSGELMPGCPLDWVESERRVLEDLYLAQGEQQASRLAPDAALPLLEKLRVCAPLRESLLRLQLTVLCRLGNRAEAQQAYYDFRRQLLEKRLGEPSPQTQEAWKTLQSVQAATNDKNAAPAAPPLSATLPTPLTACLGRERELDAITHLIANHRLVTLVGMGGIGKTRLAIEVARRYDQVVFLELAEWKSSQPLAETLDTLLQEALPLRDADAPLLLVLDNFEQLVGPEAIRVVRAQLEKHPQVRCLVTSRRVLGGLGERLFPLEPLDLPQHPSSLARLLDFASVQIFVERARAACPSFDLTYENAAAVVGLCQQAEGVPLGLELLAAHLRSITPESLLAQVTQTRLPLLARQKAGDLPRHQSLWRIIESSVALLTDAERTGFWQVCVFRGGWSLEAAQAVCAGGAAQDPLQTIALLESLTDNSLVRFANGRYTLLETLREWGRATQPDCVGAQARRDHAAFFLALAEKYGATPGAFVLLDTEQDNLQAAFDFYLDENDLDSALRWMRLLRPYWFHRPLGRIFGERLLSRLSDRPENRASRAELQEIMGALCAMSGDYAAAQAHLQNALRYFRDTGAPIGQAKVLANLAGIAIDRGEYESARAALEEALPFWRAADHPRGLAIALANLGIARTHLGDLDAAEPLIDEALRLRVQMGDSYGIATCLINRGAIELRRSANATAESTYRDALSRFQQIMDRRGEAVCLEGLAEVFLNRNEPNEALRHLREVAWLRQEFRLPETALQAALYERIRHVLGEAVYDSLFTTAAA